MRVGPVACQTSDAVETFPEPVPLAVLGQPKPAQGRFYLGDKDGRAFRPGREKAIAGYTAGNRVRGPKVYPHHKRFDRQRGGWRAEPGKNQRSSQNRSVRGWVKTGWRSSST